MNKTKINARFTEAQLELEILELLQQQNYSYVDDTWKLMK